MTINLDTFVEIGDQHKICEDYIIMGEEPVPFIVLSDGCSKSKNSDMGARIFCYLVQQYLRFRGPFSEPLDYDKLGTWVIHNAELIARQLGLKSSALDATLIVAYYIKKEDSTFIHFYGDGCLVTKDESGIIIKSIEYCKMTGENSNAPYYLSYLINDISYNIYRGLKLYQSITSTYEDGTNNKQDNLFNKEIVQKVDGNIDTILIASDGLMSFLQKEDNGSKKLISPIDIVKLFLNFKNTKGEFLKRRLKSQMRDFLSVGITHFDDLSIGAFLREK